MRRRSLVALHAFAILAALGSIAASAQPKVDLSGTWVLNTELSEDPQEEFQRWLQARGVGGDPTGGGLGAGAAPSGGGPGPAGGGGAAGSYDAAGGGARGGGGGGGMLAMMQTFSQGAEKLTIAQSDPELTITRANGMANLVYTDGRLIESEGEGGGKTKVKTRWKKERMVISVDFPPRPSPLGGTVTPNLQMIYSLDKNGRLELSTTVGVGPQVAPFTVERLYDRETPAG